MVARTLVPDNDDDEHDDNIVMMMKIDNTMMMMTDAHLYGGRCVCATTLVFQLTAPESFSLKS